MCWAADLGYGIARWRRPVWFRGPHGKQGALGSLCNQEAPGTDPRVARVASWAGNSGGRGGPQAGGGRRRPGALGLTCWDACLPTGSWDILAGGGGRGAGGQGPRWEPGREPGAAWEGAEHTESPQRYGPPCTQVVTTATWEGPANSPERALGGGSLFGSSSSPLAWLQPSATEGHVRGEGQGRVPRACRERGLAAGKPGFRARGPL